MAKKINKPFRWKKATLELFAGETLFKNGYDYKTRQHLVMKGEVVYASENGYVIRWNDLSWRTQQPITTEEYAGRIATVQRFNYGFWWDSNLDPTTNLHRGPK